MQKNLWWYANLFSVYAPVYDLIGRRFMDARKAAIEAAGLQPGMRVLLAGCGTGLDLEFLPKRTEVWLADISSAMLKRAEHRAFQLGLNVHQRKADIASLPLQDRMFDVVILHFTLTLFADPQPVWVECSQMLKPGGRVSLLDWFGPVPLPQWMSRCSAPLGWAQGITPERLLPHSSEWRLVASGKHGFARRYLLEKKP